jgi:hypothetical protein
MVEIPPPYVPVFIWKLPTCRAEFTDRRSGFDGRYPWTFVIDGLNKTSLIK